MSLLWNVTPVNMLICHNFRNPVITADECSLSRFQTIPTGNTFIHRCNHKFHTDVVLQMCTQMCAHRCCIGRCLDVQMCFGHDWNWLGPIRSHDHNEDDTYPRVPDNPNPKWLPEKFSVNFVFTNVPKVFSQILLDYGISVLHKVF